MKNRITELFKIDLPIIQAGMIWCSGWELASAVSNAGGLGIIGAGSMYPAVLRSQISKCKKATNKPFAVNLPLLYPSIEEALTLGTGALAVDGVVIIAEHGNYPSNDKGQRLYPRYEWFKECVKVFEKSGRSVPVFNDKHLSTTWEQCKEMVDDSKRLNFPFFAGSSLPVTRRMPSIDVPHNVPLK